MDERSLRWEQRFEWPMVIAALLVVPLLLIEESGLGEPWATLGVALNWGTWLAFATELVVMMVVTPKRTEWLKRHPLDAAVVLLTPPFLPGNLAGARLFRLLRVLRLTRIFTLRRLLSLEGVRYAAFLVAFATVVGGAAFAAVEEDQGMTAWDGVWWAIVTVTTVGYGDVLPQTDEGRVIGGVLMMLGIGFVALVTGFIAERFIETEAGGELSDHDHHVVTTLESIDQRLAQVERRLSAFAATPDTGQVSPEAVGRVPRRSRFRQWWRRVVR